MSDTANESRHEIIYAPWTPTQVAALNRYQQLRQGHPYTCGSGRRTDEHHLDGEGVLVATENGWSCPYCDYTQHWALRSTAESVQQERP